MRRKRSWVVWCMVVALALLALAVPALQAQGADSYPGTCWVLNELGTRVQMDARIQTWSKAGEYTKVVCRGYITITDSTAVPTSYDGNNPPGPAYTCDIIGSLNWYETISRQGKVTLTCYPGP